MLEYWPLATVAGAGLIAWGDARARISGLRKDVDDKATKESVDLVREDLKRIDAKLDRLLERGADAA